MKVRWRGCNLYWRKTFSLSDLHASVFYETATRNLGDWESLVYASSVVYESWREFSLTSPRPTSSLFLDYSAIDNFKSTSKINFSPRKLIPTTEKRACLGCHKLSSLPTNQIPEQNWIYNLYYLALCDGVRISLVLWLVLHGLLKPIKEAQRIKTSTVTVSSKNWFSFDMWIVLLKIHNASYLPTKLRHIPCNTGNVQRARNGGIAPWPHNILGYTASSILLFTANECTKFLQLFRNAKKNCC